MLKCARLEFSGCRVRAPAARSDQLAEIKLAEVELAEVEHPRRRHTRRNYLGQATGFKFEPGICIPHQAGGAISCTVHRQNFLRLEKRSHAVKALIGIRGPDSYRPRLSQRWRIVTWPRVFVTNQDDFERSPIVGEPRSPISGLIGVVQGKNQAFPESKRQECLRFGRSSDGEELLIS